MSILELTAVELGKKIKDKEITVVSRSEGLELIKAKAIILAMGCRERPRGALNIPGYRPAGIYTAGTASHEHRGTYGR